MQSILALLKRLSPKLLTLGVVAAAVVTSLLLYNRWSTAPWTRDGQVRADIIKVAPEVSGSLVNVAVKDNQLVRQGELLFEIDRRSYQLAVDQAKVAVQQAREAVASLEASVRSAEAQYDEANLAVTSAERKITASEASVDSALASVSEARAGVTAAQQLINQRQAELDNARSEAARAKRLADKKAGSIEDAESTAATVLAKEAQLASARAGLAQSQAALTQSEAGHQQAAIDLLISQDARAESQAAATSAKAVLDQAKATLGLPGDQNVRVETAEVSLAQAELDLLRTRIVAPCNGYISNLSVDVGSYAAVGQPLVAIVDRDSFRVHAYFQETKLRHIKQGDVAVVTLMSHPQQELQGVVENIGNAVNPPNIAPTEGQAGEVPQIEPTFDWVRLPQRVPVRIRLPEIPSDVQLISGTTASVAVESSAKE